MSKARLIVQKQQIRIEIDDFEVIDEIKTKSDEVPRKIELLEENNAIIAQLNNINVVW